MTNNNLMQIMYDYLDAMFISHDEAQGSTSVLQLLPLGTVINPQDFANPISAVNMDGGSLAAAENFAQLVNDIPMVDTKFLSQSKLDQTYNWILENAIAMQQQDIDAEAKARYDDAFGLLNTKLQKPDGSAFYVQSERYQQYNEAQTAYEDALIERELQSMEADRTTTVGQKKWATTKRKLDNQVSRALDNLSNYRDIEDALATVKTTYTKGIKGLLAQEKDFYASSAQVSDLGTQWHFCGAYPSNWYENDKMYTSITINGDSKLSSANSKYLAAGGEASMNVGIFSGSVSAEHKQEQTHTDSATSVTSIQMEIAAVRIERPWLNETLLLLDGWRIPGYAKGHISDGTFVTRDGDGFKRNMGILPLIPKYMLIARNVTLVGNFSNDLKDQLKQNTEGKTSIGVGPFKIKGHVEHSKTDETVSAQCDDSKITMDAPQIIGYISTVLQMSPKND